MPHGDPTARGLSAREREVAQLVAAGKSNRAISQALSLSERTVEHHVTSILNKLNLHSRVELIVEMVTTAQQSAPARTDEAPAVPRNVFSRSLKVASASSSRMMFRIGARMRRATWFAQIDRVAGRRLRDVLPRPATETIGRAEDVAHVAGEIVAARVVTVVGAGGAGKSRVAIEVGFAVRASQDVACVFVDLGECRTHADVMSALAAACARKRNDSGDLATIIAALAEHEVLLILDNCERVVTIVAALVRSLIAETPSVKILATSRRPIGLAGERVVRIDALATANANASRDEVLASPAVRLFVARATDHSDFRLDDASLAATLQLCVALDGLPLALEIAAAKTSVLSVQQLLAHERDRFDLLTVETPTFQRYRSLRALIDWSYQLLEPHERQLFRAVAAFGAGWTIDDVQRLLDDVPAITVLEGLIALANHSLIFRFDGDGQPRFRMLESFRLFALEKAAESEEGAALEERRAQIDVRN